MVLIAGGTLAVGAILAAPAGQRKYQDVKMFLHQKASDKAWAKVAPFLKPVDPNGPAAQAVKAYGESLISKLDKM